MCQHKQNLTPSRLRADYQRGNVTGASTTPVPGLCPPRAEAMATTRDDERVPGVAHAAPGNLDCWYGELSETPPGTLDICFGALVFAAFALLGLVLSAWTALKEWGKEKYVNVRAWLLVHRQCSWCLKHVHYAPYGVAATTSHTICRQCMDKVKAELARQQSLVQIPHQTTTGTMQ